MESLNMNTLANSLPTSNLANAEKDLMNNFKAAAMSITTLYKSSLHTSKRAYNAGYGAALQDLLDVIQQGVSVGGVGGAGSDGGMTIGRVMDWVEARLEAVRAREEEEEEEEKEREYKSATSARVPSAPKDKEKSDSNPQTSVTVIPTRVPLSQASASPVVNRASVSPSPPISTLRPIPRQKLKSMKDKDNKEQAAIVPPSTDTFSFLGPLSMNRGIHSSAPSNDSFHGGIEMIPSPVTGSKRRHAMLESSSPVSISSLEGALGIGSPLSGSANVHPNVNMGPNGSRRRGKSGRGPNSTSASTLQNHGLMQTDAMDIEEDNGRERKRISRR